MAAKGKLKDEEKRKLNKENLAKLAKLFSYLMPYKWKFVAGLILLAIGSLLLLSFPILAEKLINIANGDEDNLFNIFSSVNSIALLLLGSIVLNGLLSFFRVYLFSVVGERSMADLRYDLYHRFLYLPIKFYDSSKTGELMSRISSDVSTLQGTFTTTMAELVRQVITLTAGITYIFWKAPELSIFMLAVFPFVLFSAFFFGKYIRRMSKKTQDELAKTNIIVEETLQGMSTVKSFTGEVFEFGRYKKAMESTVSYAIKSSLYRAGFLAFIVPAVFGTFAAVTWYGATLLQSGDLKFGVLFSFVLMMGFIGGSIVGLGSLFGQIQSAIGSSERILEILREEIEKGLQSDQKELNLHGKIELKSVSFSYHSRKDINVLDRLTIEIDSGDKVAIVGKSGAGKSTIAQLLQSFYHVDQGKILFDGKTAEEIGLKSLRSNIGIVPQEVLLFGGTIRENILYGKPTATEEEIKDAAKKANAWQFIEGFPEQLETVVGERGVKLSGGQRQRIAIARAILKNPAILILDEATSSLDAESEHLVQQALENLMEGRTTLIIAHRLATIRSADKIFILEGGKIVESGTHDELINISEGTYSNLVRLQMEGLAKE